MIEIEDLSVRYGATPVLDGVSAHVREGEMCLVVGPTGSGKSTLLGAMTAQVPHLTGGTVAGRVVVGGRDTREHLPRDLADLVGVVAQDPHLSFVTDTVEEELAFTMEQLGVPPAMMRRRVEDVLDLLGIAELRDRGLHTLSGGEAQRVAIGAVLTAQPRVLVLDEPTSALDPGAAEDVLAALSRLVLDSGLTVVLAEHRLERVVQFADHVIALDPGPPSGARAISGDPAQVFARSAIAPPVAQLGKIAGWQPLPLTVREARRAAAPLRSTLAERDPGPSPAAATAHAAGVGAGDAPLLRAHKLSVSYGAHEALRGVSLEVRAGEVLAVMGRNGAGKSSLLWALAGAKEPASGRVEAGRVPSGQTRVALVPQSPEDLLFRLTVAAECSAADHLAGRAGATRAILDVVAPGIDAAANPRDLSEGQRLALAVSLQLAAAPHVLLLDEPTRGLDYPAKERLAGILRELTAGGRGVVVASHDVEFLALLADRVVQLAGGELLADGPAAAILTDSAFTAPQVARVFAPAPILTVAQAAQLLGGTP